MQNFTIVESMLKKTPRQLAGNQR